MRFSTRFRLLAASLCAVVVVVVVVLVYGLNHGVDDAYAEWGAVDMVISYMEDHGGQWPSNWEDLRSDFDAGGGRVGGWSFEKYRSRIQIDFDADSSELRRQAMSADEPTFNVIRARHNTGVHIEDGPNRMLYDYLRSRAEDEGHADIGQRADQHGSAAKALRELVSSLATGDDIA